MRYGRAIYGATHKRMVPVTCHIAEYAASFRLPGPRHLAAVQRPYSLSGDASVPLQYKSVTPDADMRKPSLACRPRGSYTEYLHDRAFGFSLTDDLRCLYFVPSDGTLLCFRWRKTDLQSVF